MVQVFIGFGSNLGDKLLNIQLAIESINSDLGDIIHQSSLYESEPWGFESSEIFVNGVLEIRTKFSAELLLAGLKKIECDLGRKEKTSLLHQSLKEFQTHHLQATPDTTLMLSVEAPHRKCEEEHEERVGTLARSMTMATMTKMVKVALPNSTPGSMTHAF